MAKRRAILNLADGFVVVACLLAVLALEFRADTGIFGWLWGNLVPGPQAHAAACPKPDTARWEPVAFSPGMQFRRLDSTPLDAATQSRFAISLKRAAYFGAVAVGPDNATGWTSGFARRSLARSVALARCEAFGRGDCTLLFEVLPIASLAEASLAPCADTLSAAQGAEWQKLRDGSGPRVFARAASSAWGSGTTAEVALAACNERLLQEGLGGMATCEVMAGLQDPPPHRLPSRVILSPDMQEALPPVEAPIPRPICAAAPSGAYAPQVFSGQGRLVHWRKPELDVLTQRAFANWASRGWFGAFALAGNGAHAAVAGYGRRSEARAAALTACHRKGPGCSILAEVMPVSGHPIGECDETLNAAQAAGHLAFRQGTGTRAFARAFDGSWGAGKGNTLASAAIRAVSACEQMSRTWFDAVPGACEVVDGYEGERRVER